MPDAILQFESITKRFPGVTALSSVSFSIEFGECHAIMGENGAGKSTLGKIVGGIYTADAGRMLLDGRPIAFRSPREASEAGIAIVHQELAFCPNLSIAENLFLGRLPSRTGFMRTTEMNEAARRMLDAVGLSLDPRMEMSRLSTAQEQMVQIALAVGRGARIIVFDEPTSSLSQNEAELLFALMQRLRADGVTMLYVSHRMEEIMRLCNRVSILRDGQYVTTLQTSETTTDEIVRHMIGRTVEAYFPRHAAGAPGDSLMSVRRFTAFGRFEDVSLELRAGEILGLAGLVGAGRSEVARAIFGIDPHDAGELQIRGRTVELRSPLDAIRAGVGLLPEDRKRQALVLAMDCKENLSLPSLEQLRRHYLIDHRAERGLATNFFRRLRVRAPGIDSAIAGLSGGNQQKIALAKWLARRCDVLLLDEPTRGVDVGAKAEIHALIDELATSGKAILLISSELPELLNLSTRIIVLAGGRVVGELSRAEANQEKLMKLMAGVN
ncbi:MAG: sugar ABC transporter ATP-binding protein [Planctomycetes bacterium]|nr:sugar ABC transporter ATP-binding protein [Planctomycetota bacterium]